MLILYIKENCPYSTAVLHKLEELSISADIRSLADNRHALDLMEVGGKFQAPCLIDTKREICMYESGDIMDFLDTYFNERSEHAS